jgi:hypothetical protein
MESPNTWRDFRLSSPGLGRTELLVGKSAKRFLAFTFQSIRSSGFDGSRRLARGLRGVPH